MASVLNDPDFKLFVDITPRWERYRLAGKTFRFRIYQRLELLILLCGAIALVQRWLGHGYATTFFAAILWVMCALAIACHGKLLLNQPWVAALAATEAALSYFAVKWIAGLIFGPTFLVAGLWAFVFVWRYWLRGENEINVKAFASITERGTSDAGA